MHGEEGGYNSPTYQRRIVEISVIDLDGLPIAGVHIDLFVNKYPVGMCTTRQKAIQVEVDKWTNLHVVAQYGAISSSADLSASQNAHVFKFTRTTPPNKSLFQAGARCPDGSTGFPCVDCTAGGHLIRICV